MTSWFGTVIRMIGFRSVRTGGDRLVRPVRAPWGATLSVSTSTTNSGHSQQLQQLHQRRSNLLFFPDTISSSSLSRRQFWNWRGGDDKKWKFEKGDAVQRLRGTDVSSAHDGELLGGSQDLAAADASLKTYTVSVCSIQGFRSYMEDEFFVSLDGDFAACFDGHGGPAVSKYLRKNLYANVQAVLPLIAPATTTATTTTASLSTVRLDLADSNRTTNMERSSQTTTSAELHRSLAATPLVPTPQDYEAALETALEKVDREVQRISHWSYQGSTAVVIWIHEDRRLNNSNNTPVGHQGETSESSLADNSNADDNLGSNETTLSQRTIIVANIGDSRAVLCRNNTAWDLTRDHKPNDPLEKDRIEKQGGKVVWCGDTDSQGEPVLERGIYRVNGNLALSRAVGDRSERPHVTAEPEIIAVPVHDDDDEFIILATDGLWDVLESSEAVDLIQKLIEQGLPRDQVAKWMVDEAMRRGTYDNVTVVIIWLDRSPTTKSIAERASEDDLENNQ